MRPITYTQRLLQFLENLTAHWFFVFVLSWFALANLYQPTLLGVGCLGAISVRLCFLEGKKVRIILILSGLLLVGGVWDKRNEAQIKALHIAGTHQAVVLQVQPDTVTKSDKLWQGTAVMQAIDGHIAPRFKVKLKLKANARVDHILKHTTYQLKVTLSGQIVQPQPATNFDVFDYRQYLATQQIYWLVEADQVEEIETIHSLFDMTPLKLGILHQLQSSVAEADNLWLGLTHKLLLNQHSSAYQVLKPDLSVIGILHFFAISGFHIALLNKWGNYLLRRLGCDQAHISFTLMMIISLYLWLVSWPIGGVRVLLGMAVQQLYQRFKISSDTVDEIAMSGLICLVFQPRCIVQLGFILSYLLTYVVVFAYRQMKDQQGWLAVVRLTFVCLLFTWPIMMATNHTWYPLQILTVSVVTLLFSYTILPLALLTLFIQHWSLPLAQAVLKLLDKGCQFLLTVSEIKAFQVVTGKPADVVMLCLFGVAVYVLLYIQTKPRRAVCLVVITYTSLLWLYPYCRMGSQITIIDIGQGDAVLYQPAWSNKNYLFDTGGRVIKSEHGYVTDPNFAKQQLIPALKARQVRQIDGLIITHPDNDHMGNLLGLMNEIAVRTIYVTVYTAQDKDFLSYLEAYQKPMQVQVLDFGQQLQLESNVQLFTFAGQKQLQEDSNATSIISTIQLGEFTWLNMADAPSSVEALLIQQLQLTQPLILKLGHHGSATSSSQEMLDYTKPNLAVISVGANNSYGHPSPQVLARLQQAHIPYRMTGRDGAIALYQPLLGSLQVKWQVQTD